MVVMPEYLKSSTKQSNSKPRVISEVKKNCLSKLKLDFNARPLQDFGKSKFSGMYVFMYRLILLRYNRDEYFKLYTL